MRLLGSWIFPILLLVLGIGLFFPGLGLWDLWDLKEMRVAEAAREMIATQEFYKLQVGYKPVWDLSPLEVWWQALSMQAFGQYSLGTQLPNAIMGVVALLSVFLVGNRLHGADFGVSWALLSFCPFGVLLLFRTGLPEPVQGLFLFGSVASLAFSAQKRAQGGASLQATMAGLLLGLAVLADGFGAVLFMFLLLIAVWVLNGGRPLLAGADWVLFLLSLGLTSLLWFGYEWAVNGPDFLAGFMALPFWGIGVDDSLWRPNWLGKAALLFFGLFPTLWLAIPTLSGYREKDPADFRRWMIVFLILAAIQLLFLPGATLGGIALAAYPAGYLAALFIGQPVRKVFGKVRGLWTLIATTLLLIGVTCIFLPIWISSRAPWLTETLTKAGYESSLVWTGFEGLSAIVLFIILIPVFRLGKKQQHTPASLILALGYMIFFIASYPFLGRNLQDLVQGGYPHLFARTSIKPSYAAAITFKTYAPLFYGRRPPAMLCNGQPDSCFLKHRVPVEVYKVVPTWSYGSGRHLAGYEEIDHAGPYVLFRKFNDRPGH